MIRKITATTLLLLPASIGHADHAGDLAACRAISASSARLACYDNIGVQKASKPTDDEITSWTDLNVDYKSLRGKTVTTSGFLLIMGEEGLLYDKADGMVAFFVDIKKLPRPQRAQLYENCTSGCSLTLTGKVGDVMMQRGITATKIELE